MPAANPASDGEDRSVLSRQAREPDRVWAYGTDPDQVADVYLPWGEARSTVLLIHGGFWRPEYDRVHVRPLAANLAERGHLVISLEYRRIPGSPDVTLEDLRSALGAVAEQPWVPAVATQAMGHPAGGHLLLTLAADPQTPLQSALALAPVADLVAAEALRLDVDAVPAFLGCAAHERPDLDPARRTAPTLPVTIVHGEQDRLVPIDVTRAYLSELPDGHPRLITLADTGHFQLIDPASPAMAAVTAALDELAAPTPGHG